MSSFDDPVPAAKTHPETAPTPKFIEWYGGMSFQYERPLTLGEVKYLKQRALVLKITSVLLVNGVLGLILAPIDLTVKVVLVFAGIGAAYYLVADWLAVAACETACTMKVFSGVSGVLRQDEVQKAILPHVLESMSDPASPKNIEVIAGGNVLWRVGNRTKLTRRRPGAIVSVANRLENGPLRFLPGERDELSGHLSKYNRFLISTWVGIAACLIASIAALIFQIPIVGSLCLFFLVVLFISNRFYRVQLGALRATLNANRLELKGRDELRTVTGVPWAENGNPAAWRLSRDSYGLARPIEQALPPLYRWLFCGERDKLA